MYIPQHFTLEEFFPEQFFRDYFPRYGQLLWSLFPTEVLWTQDRLRERYGPCLINDWVAKGHNRYRGYRPFDCPVGATLSMHKFALAVDSEFPDTPVGKIRQDILEDPWHETFKYIRCIESGVSWLHWDFRNHDKKNLGIKVIHR